MSQQPEDPNVERYIVRGDPEMPLFHASIVVEGSIGTGKSKLVQFLAAALNSLGFHVLVIDLDLSDFLKLYDSAPDFPTRPTTSMILKLMTTMLEQSNKVINDYRSTLSGCMDDHQKPKNTILLWNMDIFSLFAFILAKTTCRILPGYHVDDANAMRILHGKFLETHRLFEATTHLRIVVQSTSNEEHIASRNIDHEKSLLTPDGTTFLQALEDEFEKFNDCVNRRSRGPRGISSYHGIILGTFFTDLTLLVLGQASNIPLPDTVATFSDLRAPVCWKDDDEKLQIALEDRNNKTMEWILLRIAH